MSSTALSTATVLNAGLVGGSVATGDGVTLFATVWVVDPRAQAPGTFASGVVAFFADGVPIGQAPIVVSPTGFQQIWRGRAVATLTTFAADAFNHPLTAVYQGDAAFAGSTSDSVIQAGTPTLPNWAAQVAVDRSNIALATQERDKQAKQSRSKHQSDEAAYRAAVKSLSAARHGAPSADLSALEAQVNSLQAVLHADTTAIKNDRASAPGALRTAMKQLIVDRQFLHRLQRQTK